VSDQRLGDVTPELATHDCVDECCRDVELSRDVKLDLSRGNSLADGDDIHLRKFDAGMVLSSLEPLGMFDGPVARSSRTQLGIEVRPMARASRRAPLRHHVGTVVGLRTEEKVGLQWVRVGEDARRIVAAMQDTHPVGDWPDEYLVGDAVGIAQFSLVLNP
jgi:hypothetical protein